MCLLDCMQVQAYNAGMATETTQKIQYTVRSVPSEVDKSLRAKAEREGKSLNEAIIDVLRGGLMLDQPIRRDLSDLVGTWQEDPEFDKVIEEHDQIDEEMWR